MGWERGVGVLEILKWNWLSFHWARAARSSSLLQIPSAFAHHTKPELAIAGATLHFPKRAAPPPPPGGHVGGAGWGTVLLFVIPFADHRAHSSPMGSPPAETPAETSLLAFRSLARGPY